MSTETTHRFFGFHDVAAWPQREGFIACLQVSVINRPPVASDTALVGLLSQETCEFTALDETSAFNFPQGARQLWDRQGGFWFNRRAGEGWRASRIDKHGSRTETVDQALYALSPDGRVGYGLNFSRLNRLGGYGYVGLPDSTAGQPRPAEGISAVDLATNGSNTLITIADVAAPLATDPATHHYLTHVVPNPSGTRLAFLHRWWLPDGGIGSRLVSSAADGTDIRCHAEGFLSHFDWWDDHRLVIWGRPANRADQLRRMPGAHYLGWALRWAKRTLRVVKPNATGGSMSFLCIDTRDNSFEPFWPNLLTEDGHPMFCPANRDWLSIDTYPNADRTRFLKLLNATTGQQIELGRYQYADLPLDRTLHQEAFEHVDPVVLRNVDLDAFAWARSGLHCDLHPRWKPDGTQLCFDSTHEGHRDIYVVDTSQYVEPK